MSCSKKQPCLSADTAEKNSRDIPAWLSLILAGRPWPASEASAANHHHGDSFGGQYRYEPSPNIL